MDFFSFHHLLQLFHAYGNVVVALVVGLECVGLPLPGETLLIAAAVYAGTTHHLNILLVILSATVGAIVGQVMGYGIGWAFGHRLLRRYGRHIGLNTRRLAYGRALFRRHGEKVVIISRFVVVLRTLAALLAGANRMRCAPFMMANVAGSVAWAAFYGVGAYYLGQEAKHLAGPAAAAICGAVGAGLFGAWLLARRQEQRVLRHPLRGEPAEQEFS
jgi:membrane protein DedA with SNARE-associated domain